MKTTLKYQLLNEKLEVLSEYKTLFSLLEYTDTLPGFGKGLIVFNTHSSKSVTLV